MTLTQICNYKKCIRYRKAQIEMQMQDQEKSADCSRHCRPGNQLTAQTIGRLFPLAKTYTNTNILIHIEKNKHKHSSTLCCSLFLRGVRQRAGPYGKERASPQVKPILRNLFLMLATEGRRWTFLSSFQSPVLFLEVFSLEVWPCLNQKSQMTTGIS